MFFDVETEIDSIVYGKSILLGIFAPFLVVISIFIYLGRTIFDCFKDLFIL